MTASADQRIADLEDQVAAEVAHLKKQALIVRTLEETRVRLTEGWLPPVASPRRPRHLHAVGSAS